MSTVYNPADFIYTEDGEVHQEPGRLNVMIYPEQIAALEAKFGSPIVKIALTTEDNVVWVRS